MNSRPLLQSHITSEPHVKNMAYYIKASTVGENQIIQEMIMEGHYWTPKIKKSLNYSRKWLWVEIAGSPKTKNVTIIQENDHGYELLDTQN